MKNKKRIIVDILNPKDSNISRKFVFRYIFDSEGVARINGRLLFYKYAIPSGLADVKRMQKPLQVDYFSCSLEHSYL